MPKNYTIEYLSSLRDMLEDAAGQVGEIMLKKQNPAIPDNPSDAKREVKKITEEVISKINEFKKDSRNMTYTNFKTKYLERL